MVRLRWRSRSGPLAASYADVTNKLRGCYTHTNSDQGKRVRPLGCQISAQPSYPYPFKPFNNLTMVQPSSASKGKKRAASPSRSAPAKKAKSADSSSSKDPTAFRSALVSEEVDFPRGGGSGLTPLEYKEVLGEARKEADADVAREGVAVRLLLCSLVSLPPRSKADPLEGLIDSRWNCHRTPRRARRGETTRRRARRSRRRRRTATTSVSALL